MSEPFGEPHSLPHDANMSPGDRRFWIILTIGSVTSATILGTGLFAPFEESWYWGGIYVFLGLLGFAMTIYLLRPSQRRFRTTKIQRWFVPGWIVFLLGVLQVVQWMIGGVAEMPNLYAIFLPVALGISLITLSVLLSDQTHGSTFIIRLLRILSDKEKIIAYTSVSGVLLLLMFQDNFIRSDFNTYVMPRYVTEHQRFLLKGALIGGPHQTIIVRANSNDRESLEYASELRGALDAAGWNAKLDTADTDHLPSTGVCISWTGDNPALHEKTMKIKDDLTTAFHAAGIDVDCNGSDSRGNFVLYLVVGRRPVQVNAPVPLNRIIGRWIEDYGGR